MTHNYVDAEVQTDIAGLTHHVLQRPPELCRAFHFTNPFGDAEIETMSRDSTAAINPSQLLLRRGKSGSLMGEFAQGISLPPDQGDEEISRSPPPTHAAFSPLPPANKLHAGHTPIVPRAFSPSFEKQWKTEQKEIQQELGDRSPDLDEALKGPLSLPALPGDGAADRIELQVLDAELEKIAKAQSMPGSPSSQATSEQSETPIRTESISQSRRKSSPEETEVVDGVILKKPRMNLGAPLGQV